jgi:hypothetical protein
VVPGAHLEQEVPLGLGMASTGHIEQEVAPELLAIVPDGHA